MLETAMALEQVIKNPRAAVSKAGKVRNLLIILFDMHTLIYVLQAC